MKSYKEGDILEMEGSTFLPNSMIFIKEVKAVTNGENRITYEDMKRDTYIKGASGLVSYRRSLTPIATHARYIGEESVSVTGDILQEDTYLDGVQISVNRKSLSQDYVQFNTKGLYVTYRHLCNRFWGNLQIPNNKTIRYKPGASSIEVVGHVWESENKAEKVSEEELIFLI